MRDFSVGQLADFSTATWGDTLALISETSRLNKSAWSGRLTPVKSPQVGISSPLDSVERCLDLSTNVTTSRNTSENISRCKSEKSSDAFCQHCPKLSERFSPISLLLPSKSSELKSFPNLEYGWERSGLMLELPFFLRLVLGATFFRRPGFLNANTPCNEYQSKFGTGRKEINLSHI